MSDELSWGENITSATGKTHQRLFYLRKLKQAKLPQGLMMNFYPCAIESVVIYSKDSLCGFPVAHTEKQALHKVVKTVGKIIGISPPMISAIVTSHGLRRVHNIQVHVTPCTPTVPSAALRKKIQIDPGQDNQTGPQLTQALRLLNEQPLAPVRRLLAHRLHHPLNYNNGELDFALLHHTVTFHPP